MPRSVPILLYHSISPDDVEGEFAPWVLTPDQFDEQLYYLKANGYHGLTISDYVDAITDAKLELPERPVVITFDDGLADFGEHAVPLLRCYGFAATIYLVAGCMGKTCAWLEPMGEGNRAMMSWNDVKTLPAAGIECGAHTLSHPELDTLSRSAALAEIKESKAVIERMTGLRITSFAYPHGYHDRAVRDLVEHSGYLSACAVKHGMSGADDDPFALARLMVTRDLSIDGFAGLLRGVGARDVLGQSESFKTRAWRQARKLAGSLGLRQQLEVIGRFL